MEKIIERLKNKIMEIPNMFKEKEENKELTNKEMANILSQDTGESPENIEKAFNEAEKRIDALKAGREEQSGSKLRNKNTQPVKGQPIPSLDQNKEQKPGDAHENRENHDDGRIN